MGATAASKPGATIEPERVPQSIAIGDLNGDHKPELATANSDITVSVLANRGDGSFQAKRDYLTRSDLFSVAIGDLNGDGKPDLATANYNTVSVFLNATGRCVVPSVRGMTLLAARRTIARADCRTGRIRPAYSNTVKRGRVMSQKPRPGRVLPRRGRVNLVVSRGRKH
jgi:hypothetical protein